jgi:hypothetical protein
MLTLFIAILYNDLINPNFALTNIFNREQGGNHATVNVSTTGTIISRNINDTNVPLIVRKQQGTGNILELRTGTSDKKLEVDVNGWFYQNGTRFIHNAGTDKYIFGLNSGTTTTSGTGRNVALGSSALLSITTGSINVAVGRSSLNATTTGNDNVGVGHRTGVSLNASASQNTFIGTDAGNNASQLVSATNSTAIGNQAYTDKSNQMVFGNASVTEFKFDRNTNALLMTPRINSIVESNTNAITIRRNSNNTNDYSSIGFRTHTSDGINYGEIRSTRTNTDVGGASDLSFYTFGSNYAERMVIKHNGNVGIGTASPVNALSVISPSNTDGIQIRRNSNTTDDYARLGFRINASDNNFNFAEIRGVLTNRINANDTDLIFLTFTGGGGSLTEKMRIRDDGKVGIGTSSPASQFSVSNGTVFNNVFTGGTEGYLGTSSNHRLFLITNFSIRQTITNDGLVGINETTPTAQLQVKSAATNRVPLIVDSLTGQTANLQEWQVNGTNVALVRNGAFRATLGIENLVSANRALVYLFDNGTIIQRNIADSNPALIVNQANASSTGDILKLRKAGTDVYAFTHDGTLKAPATFTIDPSAHGDATGKVIILGDLQVDGTTTTINSTTLEVDDKNIELSKGAANKAASDGAGISIDLGTDGAANLTYGAAADKLSVNKNL